MASTLDDYATRLRCDVGGDSAECSVYFGSQRNIAKWVPDCSQNELDMTLIVSCNGSKPDYAGIVLKLVDSPMEMKRNKAILLSAFNQIRSGLYFRIVFFCSEGRNRSPFAALFYYLHRTRRPFIGSLGAVYPIHHPLPAYHFLILLDREEQTICGRSSTTWGYSGSRNKRKSQEQLTPPPVSEEFRFDPTDQLPTEVDTFGLKSFRLDAEGRVHNDEGAALRYWDGRQEFWEHGVRVVREEEDMVIFYGEKGREFSKLYYDFVQDKPDAKRARIEDILN